MIQTKKDLEFYLHEDFQRNGFAFTPKGRIKRIALELYGNENACALGYISVLRKCEYHFNNRSSSLHKLLYYFYMFRRSRKAIRYNIRIPLNVVGYGLRIHHLGGGGGCHLSVRSMGNYCGVNAGVLCGNHFVSDDRPTIGNNVMLHTGCKVFGAINIGDNVIVGSNAIVNKDVPANCIVAGVPARIIKRIET